MVPEESVLENVGESCLTRRPQGPHHQSTDPLIPTAWQGSGPATAGQIQGWALTWQQLRALLLKRCLLACRSHRSLFAQVRA